MERVGLFPSRWPWLSDYDAFRSVSMGVLVNNIRPGRGSVTALRCQATNMPKGVTYCSVSGCGRTQSLHKLPSDSSFRNEWLNFIFDEVPAHVGKTLRVCSFHFTAESFVNKTQFDTGFAERLRLKHNAVPSLLDPTGMVQQTYSQKCTSVKHVACQTDTRHLTTTQGTQLALKTLGPKFRSKGTQTPLSCKSEGVSTTTSGDTFTSLQDFSLELEREESVSSEAFDSQDTTYEPAESVTESSQRPSIEKDAKYIVFEKCLLQLFESCPGCTRHCDVRARRKGTLVAVDQLCPHCHYFRKWQSQPVVGSTPLGDLQLSAAVYFTGASFFKLQKVFNAMHVKMITHSTFRKHASLYLEPAIIYTWKKEQEEVFRQLSHGDKVIAGGGVRADSTGHSVKYGTYTLMDLESNLILDIQLVQSNEVAGSSRMEKEGLKRSLEHLEAHGVKLECVVTDRHPQIQTFLRELNITQFYDIWHLEKGLSKKLKKISKDKDCEVVKKWQQSIKNHVFWTAATSHTHEERAAKWKSLINHIQDIHVHDDPSYPQCEHDIRQSTDRRKWFRPGSKALYAVEKILTNERMMKDIEKLSPHFQTSSLKSFHSVTLRFAPKKVLYPYLGKLCRLYLAGLHFNENSNRPPAKTSTGKPMCGLLFPKAKKRRYSVRPLKSKATYCYVLNLMTFLFEKVIPDPLPYMEEIHRIKVSESAQYDRLSMEEADIRHVSRFSRVRRDLDPT
ncbi:uncharacterized protein [Pseudorasbora parva]|uniref:uncharacterized protein isoform X2 n=1 Tax=Pseudorasbora parva TaxID=51549 RepID=UPI00351ED01E